MKEFKLVQWLVLAVVLIMTGIFAVISLLDNKANKLRSEQLANARAAKSRKNLNKENDGTIEEQEHTPEAE